MNKTAITDLLLKTCVFLLGSPQNLVRRNMLKLNWSILAMYRVSAYRLAPAKWVIPRTATQQFSA
ncbi:hypothetical protein FIU92_18735 (plasmid) [Ruegeria sp. THAF33]|nr:hypothetical protein FIU92_18735 [Ruegeria sp. THAF33]